MMTQPQDQPVELRSVDIMSLARFLAIFNGLVMLASALVFAFVSDYASEGQAMTLFPAMLRIGFNALCGLVAGLVWGVMYNAIAGVGGLRLTVRRIAAEEEEEPEAAPAGPAALGAPVRSRPTAPATATPVDRQAARRQEKVAFAKSAAVGAVVLLAIIWLVLLMPMEGAYRECKQYSAEGEGGQGVSGHYRCLQASAKGRAYGFLYPIKRSRMRQWGREAELQVALDLNQLNYPLAAAAYATRYLRHPVDGAGSKQAQEIVDYAKWRGFTAEEVAAAAKLQGKLTHFVEKGTLGDTEFYFSYRLKNDNRQRLKPVSCIWLIGPSGRQDTLPFEELKPGQTVKDEVTFSQAKGTANFGSRDIMILPIRACPVQ